MKLKNTQIKMVMNTTDPMALAHSDALWTCLPRKGLKKRGACKSSSRVDRSQPYPVVADSQGIRAAMAQSFPREEGSMDFYVGKYFFKRLN